ncbi:carboxypeptidase regulatory-like domain-containing protein [bacterium]|nr:carboxypeptidase regulatory-like domain-containing protein [bacterium]
MTNKTILKGMSILLYILSSSLYIAAEGISVSGKVNNDIDKPLQSAEVVLFGIQDPVTTTLIEQTGTAAPVPAARVLTNEAGKFTLQAPSHGLWMIQVRAPGYVAQGMLLSPLLDDVELPVAKMIRDSGLTIRVLSPSATPISEALVIADDKKEPSYGENPWLPARRAGLTSSEGVLRLSAGSKENLTVSINAKGYAFLEKKDAHGPSISLQLSAGTQSTLEIFDTKDHPVSGASIQLGDSNYPLGLTDDRGRIDLITNLNSKISFHATTRDQRKYDGEFQAKTDPSKPFRIILKNSLVLNGKILNLENRMPVEGGLVWTSSARWNTAVSAKDGTFSLKLLNGIRNLRAAAPGFTIYQNYDPQPPANRRIFTIALQPEAQLLGVVLNQRNQPVANAEVELLSRYSVYRFSGVDLNEKQTTKEDGSFRFTRLNPERFHVLTIRAKGYARAVREEKISTPTKKQIKIVLTPEISATGRVVDMDDHPLSGIPLSIRPSVVAMSGNDMVYSFYTNKKIEGQTDNNGVFQIGELSPGKYDFEAGGKGYSNYQKIGLEIPETRKPLDLGKIVLAPAIALDGRVLDTNKQPVEGAQIHVRPNDPYTGFSGEEDPNAVSGVDGYFSVPDQTPGNVIDLLVRRTGFVEKKLEEFPLLPGEPLTITLQAASRVSGIVVDSSGQPVVEASLQLLKRVVRGTRTINTDQHSSTSKNDGTFEFIDIPPDRYVLAVRASGWQDYEMEGVELSQGKDVNDLRVTLLPEAFVEGTVLMSDGQPAIGANIKTASEETRRYRPGISQAWTDGSGNYILHGLKQGKAMLEATHKEAPRQVKDIELKPGSNRLDFQLESGYAVSGRVQDESGAGLSNVSIRIYVPSVYGLTANSAEDGTFSFKSVPNGEHELEVTKEGYAVSEQIKVQVKGAPVEGFTITMKKGAVIQGQILGLPPEKLSLVYIEGYSESAGNWVTTKPDYQSAYALRSIVPGQWKVTASVTGSGASVTKNVSVEQNMSDVHLDLEFSRGIVLDGIVLSDDSPVSNATVIATGKETDSYTYSTTRGDGTFHIEGLTKGPYKIRVWNWQEGWEHQEDLDLQEDKKITIQLPSNRITGNVFDVQDRSPLAGVTVSLLAPNANPNASSGGGSVTDSTGRFVIKNMISGSWMLTAKKEGYASQNQPIMIEENQEISGIELLLQPTGGVTLEIRNSFGIFMESIAIAVLNSAGQILSVANYSSQGNGRFRISTIPSGTWELILSDYNSAQTNVMVTVPQHEPAKINLQPAAKLRVKVPALSGDQSIAKMTLTGSDGRPYRSLRSWTGSIFTEIDVYSGEAMMEMLPAGPWNISVTAPDGRHWQKALTTSAGTTTEAILE